jgi:hypothetical protein
LRRYTVVEDGEREENHKIITILFNKGNPGETFVTALYVKKSYTGTER